MTSMTPEQPGKFRIGRVLRDTFAIIRRNPVLCLGVALFVYALPEFGFSYWFWVSVGSVEPEYSMRRLTITAIFMLGFFVLGAFMQAALTRAALIDLRGERPSARDCIRTACALLLPASAASILITFAFWLGLVLIIVPGLLLLARWSVTTPVIVGEGRGVFASMQRSRDLTKGSRWPLLCIWLVVLVPSITVDIWANAFFFSFGLTLGFLLNALVDTAQGLVVSIAIVVMYVELRQLKEGTSIDDLAEIFS
ncbi:hypothetical protein [Mesorhizobium sp. M0030]|uniref:hypothetical protein n=1 Tax=Mesorhizobium sp. M0030 TaxID=2956851 RepID=UPI0033359DAA